MQLITMLNDFEAVTSGDVMIIQLPSGRKWDIDGKRIETFYGKGTQVSVAKDAVISAVTSAQRVLKYYVNGDSEISSERMNAYRADFDYGDNYPDLETEFQHRKLDGLLINEIYNDLQHIKGYVRELEVKVKSDNTRRLAIKCIDELQIKLGENK